MGEMDGNQHVTPGVCAPALPVALLTFLVLEPELLLDLLAGEVDGAAELGAIQRLRNVVGAKLLDEGEQLLPAAVLVQDLQDVCKACGREAGAGQVGQAGLAATAQGKEPQRFPAQVIQGLGWVRFLLFCVHLILWNPQPAVALTSFYDSSP